MFQYLFKLTKYIPHDVNKTIHDIDYENYLKNGKKVILFDIDNTVGPYSKDEPNEDAINLFKRLHTLGFRTIVWSNNHAPRVSRYASFLESEYIYSARKPFKTGFKKFLRKNGKIDPKECLSIGDQLMTDVLLSNRLGIDCILVKPIERKDEKWYTRASRRMADSIMRRLKKKYPLSYHMIRSIE